MELLLHGADVEIKGTMVRHASSEVLWGMQQQQHKRRGDSFVALCSEEGRARVDGMKDEQLAGRWVGAANSMQ